MATCVDEDVHCGGGREVVVVVVPETNVGENKNLWRWLPGRPITDRSRDCIIR